MRDSEIDEVIPFRDNNLKGLVVLKEGMHYGSHRGWGFRHIVKEHLKNFIDVFGIDYSDEELLNLIKKIIKDGKITDVMKDPKGGWDVIFEYEGKQVYMVISDSDKGIITAYPMT